MTKNKLEKKFSDSLQADPELWGMKLHNNPLAHNNTPADYIISHQRVSAFSLTLHLVECKQVTCDDDTGLGRLAFKRLKQMHDLVTFEELRPRLHFAWFCIAYKEKYWAKSEVYLVPAYVMQNFIKVHPFVSINRATMKMEFEPYRAEIKNGKIDLSALKRA